MLQATELIVFGQWMPDLGEFSNEGALRVENCLPEGEKYKPFAELLENSDALPSVCKGGCAYRDAAGNVTIFAGTNTGLYKLDGLAWTEVTRVDGSDVIVPYTTADEGFWDFVGYDTLVICTNYNDDIQCFDMASSDAFEQLSPTAPRARRLMVLSNFVVALDIVDGDGAVGYGIAWGPILNPRGDWTPAPTTTQADKQKLYGGDYSIAAGVTMRDWGLIVQGKTLWRMDYVGGAQIFTIEKLEQGRGSAVPRSVVGDGDRAFFYDEAGFYMHQNGTSRPIGEGKIDKWFAANLNKAYSYNINTAIDAVNKVVLWSFPSIASNGGICDRILVYNWSSDRFTLIRQDAEVLFNYLSVGYTIEQVDDLYENLDEIPFSLDSQYWVGGKSILGAFSTNHKLSSFTGEPKTAVFGTPEVRLNTSGKAEVHNLIAYVEGGSKRGRHGVRDKLTIPPNYSVFVQPNTFTDEFDFLRSGVYHRADVEVSGAWKIAHGMALRFQPAGDF